MIGILLVALVAAVFFHWYFSHKARTRERLLIIEKGLDPALLPRQEGALKNFRFPWMKIGVVVASAALGLLVATLVVNLPAVKANNDHLELIATGILFLFAGLGMILAFFAGRQKDNN